MKTIRLILSVFSLILVAGFFIYKSRDIQKNEVISNSTADETAPDFPDGMEWLNSDHPLTLKSLRGKIVLLDFWTYCCINCMHVIPDLKKLEQKYRDELIVIGVHSAKFSTEQETQNIREAIMRYDIEHPVVNDKDMRIWNAYGVNAWPSMVLIDPLGKVVGSISGEGVYEPLDGLIGQLAADFSKRGLLDHQSIPMVLEKSKVTDTPLSFPGKILADGPSQRLFIADSNHNRIVVTDLKGSVMEIIGKGEEGFKDGAFSNAEFNHPQGLSLNGEILYVADTENHSIRQIDLKSKTVKTIAGSGKQAERFHSGGEAKAVDLNSPWDLLVHDNFLYVAMAGFHQIWRMDLKVGRIEPYAGSGREARVDGPLKQAALAQPSGITTDGRKLYVADSETSSIRSIDLNPEGRVETIVGLDLFEFGDRDGKGDEVRLQHPLGITYFHGALFVADTYNNKIKLVSPTQKTSVTYGKSLFPFNEPGGLSVAAGTGKVFVADTNNHAIRVAYLKTSEIETLSLKGLKPPLPEPRSEVRRKGESVSLPPQTVAPGEGKVVIFLNLPAGYKINEEAPSRVTMNVVGDHIYFDGEQTSKKISKPVFPLTIPVTIAEGEGILKTEMVLYYCMKEKGSLCYFKEANLEVPVHGVSGGESNEIKINYSVKL